jgi:MoxR-like ATPase
MLSASDAQALFTRISDNVEKVMRGQRESVRRLLAAFAAGGHVLLEDMPGTGKTTLAKALAASIGAQFTRIQFTPDLLPTDILGVSVFNQKEQVFDFRPGPVFTNILLADEINRASPRTQSALLEVMAEQQVSVEGRTRPVDELFFVIATQNPVEFRGTYPLPEAQMDRFAMCLSLGYVDADTEVAVLAAQDLGHPLATIGAVASREEVLALKHRARRVRMSDELRHYVVEIVRRTRSAPQVVLGCGPRASLALEHGSSASSGRSQNGVNGAAPASRSVNGYHGSRRCSTTRHARGSTARFSCICVTDSTPRVWMPANDRPCASWRSR